MNCREFDVLIDEILSGVISPAAHEHMRHCERCMAQYRAQAAVHGWLHQLAVADPGGPSPATDRAVLQSFRRLQARRVSPPSAGGAQVALPTVVRPADPKKIWPRWLWSGAAAAALLLAGSTLLPWRGAPMGARRRTATPATLAAVSPHDAGARAHTTLPQAVPAAARVLPQTVARVAATRLVRASRHVLHDAAADSHTDSVASGTELTADARRIVLLASANNGAKLRASSTWPGYSNLMYCDPVACAGPMQVVHIKVRVSDRARRSADSGYLAADVVVGADGVARAIRVHNEANDANQSEVQ